MHGLGQVLGTQRAPGAPGVGADDPLDELHVQEPPAREALLVGEERLGEHLEHRVAILGVDLLEGAPFLREQGEEQRLQGRPLEGPRDHRRERAVLLERRHEVRVPEPARGLDGAELRALRATRAAEIAAELHEALRGQRVERRELVRDELDERVDALHGGERGRGVEGTEVGDELVELVQQHLEPELGGLMDDDEEELVGVLGRRLGPLEPEEGVELEVRRVGDLARGVQNVATSSARRSSARIVSKVKKGSPYRQRMSEP